MARPFITQFISSFVSSFIGGDPWWGAWDPINGFAFDFKTDLYMSQGVDISQLNAVTEVRSTDAYVLGVGGNYILRFGPRTNLCVNKDFTALVSGANSVITHMPLEPGMDGSLGSVYRVQFPATTATNTVIATVPAGTFTTALNVKEFSLVNNQFGLFTPGGTPTSTNGVASSVWERVTLTSLTPGADIFLLNAGDAYITDILVEKPQVELGDTATPYIETTGTAVTVPAEPAQADGHGLDGFDELVNHQRDSRRITGVDANPTPSPVASTVTTPFGDTGAWTWAVGTNTGKRQTNDPVPAVAGVISYSFLAIVGGAGAQARALEGAGLAGGDSGAFTFDFDTMTTLSGRGPDVVQTLRKNVHRLTFFYTNTGAETTGLSILNPFADAIKDNVSFDQFQWTLGEFVPPVIVTTGVAGTRNADDTRVRQGEGPELVTNGTFDTTADWAFSNAPPGISGGVCKVENSGAAEGSAGQAISPVVGQQYDVTFDVVALSGGTGAVTLGGNRMGPFSVGTHTRRFTPTSTGSLFLQTNNTTPGDFVTFDNVTVKAVTIAPGISANPNELTFRVDWDGVAAGAPTRYLFSMRNHLLKRVALFIIGDGRLWFGADEGGFQLIDAGASFDDGLAHTAVCYFNRSTSLFKMSVDGEATISGTLTGAVPPNLNQAFISQRSNNNDNANGTNCQIYFAEGDKFDEFKGSSAGFF